MRYNRYLNLRRSRTPAEKIAERRRQGSSLKMDITQQIQEGLRDARDEYIAEVKNNDLDGKPKSRM